MSTENLPSLGRYYKNPDVRARLLQFMGGASLESVTTQFVTGDNDDANVQYLPFSTSHIWDLLNAQQDVGRSLWDQESLIIDLDIEYVNFDQPALPFVQPKLCYELQRPVVAAVEKWLLRFGIAPLHWISGQGHHFAWKIAIGCDAFDQLSQLGNLTDSLKTRYQKPCPPDGKSVGLPLGSAFSGLGMLMEHVSQEIKKACQGLTEIPIALTAVEAGPVRRANGLQRETIALDISEYGDPLNTRGVRMPFSVYFKPSQKRYQLGDSFVDAMPPMFPIPLFEMDVASALDVMRDAQRVAELAKYAPTSIPDFSRPMLGLINEYRGSELAKFHRSFYKAAHESPDRWPATYDRFDLNSIPSCARQPLQQPNDLLLKPALIQHVVRTLMAIGWTPRHIAGLIRSKYERDYGWGDRWLRYDASSRADFYVRMFAGAIVTECDALVDFNCKSTQEKHYCPVEHCGNNLIELRDQLQQNLSNA